MENLFLLVAMLIEHSERKQKPVNKKISLIDKIEITINIDKS